MSESAEQRKLAAIMFTDMVGYTALTQRNETLALRLLEDHRRVLRNIFPSFNGREIETTGDGFLVEFLSSLEAVRCAIEIQRALAARNIALPSDEQIQVRIGIHLGDIVHKEGRVLGDGVNIAARLQPLAEPGGICVSVDVARQVQRHLEAGIERVGATDLKNVDVPMEIYRIVLPWQRSGATRATPEDKAGVKPRKARGWRAASARIAIPIIISLIILWAGWQAWRRWGARPTPSAGGNGHPQALTSPVRSLAVKPFDYFGGETNQMFLADGMTDVLTTYLGNISVLEVRGRSSVMKFKGTQKTILEIARELDVDSIVEGSIQCKGNQMLINVQLIDGRQDRHLWATNYIRDLDEFFTVQSELAQAIAQEINIHLNAGEKARFAAAGAAKPEVTQAYLEGRFFWNKRTGASLTNAIKYFQQAIAADPAFAPAYAGLGDSYASLCYYGEARPMEMFPLAKKAVQTALALDDTLAEAHASLAFIQSRFDWDWTGAEKEFRRAIQLNPSLPSAHYWYAAYLTVMKRHVEAIAQIQIAQRLDPLSLGPHLHAAMVYWLQRKDKMALEMLKKLTELDPSRALSHLFLSHVSDSLGMTNEALAAITRGRTLLGDDATMVQAYRETYRMNGMRGVVELDLQKQLDESPGGYQHAFEIARAYSWLGNTNQALEWLEKGFVEHNAHLHEINVNPMFDNLRGEPRFVRLLQQMGFTQ